VERQEADYSEQTQGTEIDATGPIPKNFAGVRDVANIAASFQEAVVDCLIGKAELALQKSGYRTLCVGGGVAANSRFRDRLELSAKNGHYTLHVPPLSLCTDNAVMGAIAIERLQAGLFEDLSLDIGPGPERASVR
jgi:N6-L-threonylcarbamoyladenine synthase